MDVREAKETYVLDTNKNKGTKIRFVVSTQPAWCPQTRAGGGRNGGAQGHTPLDMARRKKKTKQAWFTNDHVIWE